MAEGLQIQVPANFLDPLPYKPIVSFYEKPESGSMTENPPSLEKQYVYSGEEDENKVLAWARAMIPGFFDTAVGRLFRQDIKSERIGYRLFHLVATFGRYQYQVDKYTFSGTTTGGTTNCKAGTQVFSYYASNDGKAPQHYGLIGVHDNQVDGVDVVVPQLNLQVEIVYALGHVNIEWVNLVSAITGKTNKEKFMTYEPGEVLYRGMTFSDGTETECKVTHDFAISKNVRKEDNVLIGGIGGTVYRIGAGEKKIDGVGGISKKGWDVAWIEYGPDADSTTAQQKAIAVHVVKVYQEAELSPVLGFGYVHEKSPPAT